VIYYFHSERIPLYVLKFYAKNEKSDLRGDEIIRLRAVVKAIASTTQ
jgi:hypothetical protein